MQILELPPFLTIVLDFAAWLLIHVAIALLAVKIPARHFSKDSWIYRTRAWEDNGRIWHKLFKVRKWKKYLPDGGAVFSNGFSKKTLMSRDSEYFRDFIIESRRAEFMHLISILPAPLFFLWNPVGVGLVMIIYAIGINMPCIIAQRYNRPRFALGAGVK